MKKLIVVFLAIICLIISPEPAMAYLDPGSGSAIISAIIGFFVAGVMVVKTYWYKITSFFSNKKNKDEKK